MRLAGFRSVLVLLFCALGIADAHAQPSERGRSGAELYVAACAACHATDGTGSPQALVGFDDPIPDFTDCSFATPEAGADWFAVAHAGGPVRAFSRRMPSFGAALSAAELERIIDHVRRFCDDPTWPRGELNLPRALVTEKAYPENEALLTTSVQKGAARELTNEFIYERRFGVRNQFEVAVPLTMQANEGDRWLRGLGDIAVAAKRSCCRRVRTGKGWAADRSSSSRSCQLARSCRMKASCRGRSVSSCRGGAAARAKRSGAPYSE
jgi:mono/diheme cytochrome c family protein